LASEHTDPNDTNHSRNAPARPRRPAAAASDAFGAGLDLDRGRERRTRSEPAPRREPAPQREAPPPREAPPQREPAPQREAPQQREAQPQREAAPRALDETANGAHPAGDERTDWRSPDRRRGGGRRGGRRRRRGRGGDGQGGGNPQQSQPAAQSQAAPAQAPEGEFYPENESESDGSATSLAPARSQQQYQQQEALPREGGGILVNEMGGFGTLRQAETNYLAARTDIFVPGRLIQQHRLREGSFVEGRLGRGQRHKYALNDVFRVDGKPPAEVRNLPEFRSLTSIDPDFHYATGDITDEVSMRIIDLLCPIGRGQRGLIVAPPRSGKTTILRQFAKGIEQGYPDVQLMVLLVDERPEEATEWKRTVKGHVYCSTSDESPRSHVQIAEFVWKRAMRLVELGQDVVLLLDSITRLARAYNNLGGGSGKTMSGGLDSKAMERPRQFFGSARNTEKAGSLTILGTTLVDTGSRMDQLIFEEFKGTGNMELVLSRKLADRRIFPAIDIEKSGTRKEEKLLSARKLKSVQILRRVLTRMHFAEAMDLLITKLQDVEKTDDFLKRFEVDPEA
jgi:transcription termination factor Rho